MRFLLDTHTFLWFINGHSSLSDYAREQIENIENIRLLSIASLWEMAIKVSIGKLKIGLTFKELYKLHVKGNAVEILEIAPEHLDILKTLPFHHKDPFDRLIISQSIAENIPVLSCDELFDYYKNIKRFW
ncbi:MAG: type II toxin-antitoxin system VapC family toxin [Desulfamplus sp.]|nr:type II toxin-antitoxin system VapC family toxin [Desulfamplus sp.]